MSIATVTTMGFSISGGLTAGTSTLATLGYGATITVASTPLVFLDIEGPSTASYGVEGPSTVLYVMAGCNGNADYALY